MELGIDIGDLDATLLTGYPGTIASAWQQAGRSGRSGHRSLSVLVAQDNPLDQYLMRHPEAFFGKPHESARVSPGNPYILKPHLLCAAYEAPLVMEDTGYFGAELLWHADELVDDELLFARNSRWYLSAEVEYPAGEVNIRSASARTYSLVEKDSGVILETVEEMSAFMQLHPGGIYLAPGGAVSHHGPGHGGGHCLCRADGRALLHAGAGLYGYADSEAVSGEAGGQNQGISRRGERYDERCGLQAGGAHHGGIAGRGVR